jgi:CheY-like chemotaxis protein
MAMTDVRFADARQLRFLVVDDCEDIRDVFCCSIERSGHLTRTARDGLEAVDIVQRESFDVMLLDLSMPRMGGVEVARWLRAHPDVAPAMRVVVVTAWDEKNVNLVLELGVTTVLLKPLPLQRLRALMTETIQALESAERVRLNHPETRAELLAQLDHRQAYQASDLPSVPSGVRAHHELDQVEPIPAPA